MKGAPLTGLSFLSSDDVSVSDGTMAPFRKRTQPHYHPHPIRCLIICFLVSLAGGTFPMAPDIQHNQTPGKSCRSSTNYYVVAL